jgi:parvulin-like peptidyl-prolyl isomerase
MKLFSFRRLALSVATAIAAAAQPGATPVIKVGSPQAGIPGAPVPSTKVVATIDGTKITAARLRELLTGAPPPALRSAQSDPREFLAWTALTEKFMKQAEKEGLDKKSPYSDRLHWTRHQVLTMARIQAEQKRAEMTEEQAKQWYAEHAYRFGRAGVRLIYVAKLPGKEAEAQAKLAEVQKRLKSGESFDQVARALSDDDDSAAKGGDYGVIEQDSKIPLEIRKAVLKLAVNQVSPVFEQPAGYYLFQVTSKELRDFAEAKAEILEQAKRELMDEWMRTQREKVTVKIVNEPFFKTLRAANLAAGQDAANLGPEVKPDTVLAEINGQPLNAEQYTGLMKGMPPQNRTNAVMNPEEFLRQYAFMQQLTKAAEEMGLDKQQPYQGQLWYNRGQILLQAFVDEYLNNIVVTAEEQKAGYDRDPDRFRIATVAAIRIPYSVSPPPQTDPNAKKILNEEEARARAEAALAEVVAGLNFQQAVVKYAEDQELVDNGGILPPLAAQDPQVPENIKTLVFNAKTGDVLGPVKMPNGFYLFKVLNLQRKSYDEVKDQIYEELRQERFQKWFDGERQAFRITVDDPQAFQAIAAEQGR